jgi:hypothetical protein
METESDEGFGLHCMSSASQRSSKPLWNPGGGPGIIVPANN